MYHGVAHGSVWDTSGGDLQAFIQRILPRALCRHPLYPDLYLMHSFVSDALLNAAHNLLSLSVLISSSERVISAYKHG